MDTKAHERVWQTLAGETTDRPPLCLWHHFRPEGSPQTLAAATVDFFSGFELDIHKVMPDLPYPDPPPAATGPALWDALPVLGAGPGEPLHPMAEAVAAVRRARPQAVVLATVFSPLALALRFAGGGAGFRQHARTDAATLRRGLATLTANTAGLCRACLRAGADGIYFATAGLGDDLVDEADYQAFGGPTDREVLAAAAAGRCTVVHLHAGRSLNWRWAIDYPAAVFSWSDRTTGIPLREVAAALPGRTVMGGIDETGTGAIVRGDRPALEAEMRDAVRQTGGRRLILAGGCSLPDDVAPEHIRLARQLVDRIGT